MTWYGGGRGARIPVPGAPDPALARARPGQMAGAGLMMLATVLTGISMFSYNLTLAVLVALGATVTYGVSAIALARGRTGLGSGLALGVGTVGFASNVSLLSFQATGAYYLLNLVACLVGAVAGLVAASTGVSERRGRLDPTWLTVLGIAVVGTVLSVNLPWLRVVIPGQDGSGTVQFDCCPAYQTSDWDLATDLALMLAVVLLLGWAAARGVTPRAVGVAVGVGLGGLAALISPLYQGLNYLGESLLPAIWLAVGVLVLLVAVGVMEAGRLDTGEVAGERPPG
jgi:hypothetical protein